MCRFSLYTLSESITQLIENEIGEVLTAHKRGGIESSLDFLNHLYSQVVFGDYSLVPLLDPLVNPPRKGVSLAGRHEVTQVPFRQQVLVLRVRQVLRAW